MQLSEIIFRHVATASIALMLGGCAGSPLRISCAPFRTHFSAPVPSHDIVEAISSDSRRRGGFFDAAELAALLAEEGPLGSPMSTELSKQMKISLEPMQRPRPLGRGEVDDADAQPVYLMLSGGGQWGAYGAGFFEALADSGDLPRAYLITGVSTGGLQALYLGAHQNDPDGQWLKQLRQQYSPKEEAEIVDRGSWFGAAVTGSVAKLAPLRTRIEAALCPPGADGKPKAILTEDDCPLIKALAQTGRDKPVVLLGYVEADSGRMLFTWVNHLATGKYQVADPASPSGIRTEQLSVRDRQQCLTATALASAAVPVQYQQLRIVSDEPQYGPQRPGTATRSTEKAYMDGGVRQSVFFALPRALLEAMMNPARSDGAALPDDDYTELPGTTYVMRNGPTDARPDDAADRKSDAFTAAMRGYALLVNQSEVSSIAALRLYWPTTPMKLSTADGYGKAFTDPDPTIEGRGKEDAMWPAGCHSDMTADPQIQSPGMMFNPVFMRCLRAYGRYKARLADGTANPNGANRWINLPKIEIAWSSAPVRTGER